MIFDPPLERGILLRRYKRFFADIERQDGSVVTAHCPNTGSMMNCLLPGSDCYFSANNNPARKLRFSLELVSTEHGGLACINTHRANKLVGEALAASNMPGLGEWNEIRAEQKFGDSGSRFDFRLSNKGVADCFVEIKSVTLVREPGLAEFPDAVSTRGQKHLQHLLAAKQQGFRAVLMFVVLCQRAERMAIAADIDPEYARLAAEAQAGGVEILASLCRIDQAGIAITDSLPVDISGSN